MPDTQQPTTALTIPEAGKESAEIIRSSRHSRQTALAPANFIEVTKFAQIMSKSDMIPKAYRGKPADMIGAIMYGYEIGLGPMQALRSVAMINGNPSLWGDAALALVQGHAEFEDIIEEQTDEAATCIVKRKLRSPVKRTFTAADAARAGLLAKKGVWDQYRKRMLQMRARGFALRDSFADVLSGISLAEEAMDYPEAAVAERAQLTSMDVASLTPSNEPNRGHDDTGLEKNKTINGTAVPKKEEQAQAAAKEAPAMCSECREIGKHAADCKYAEQDKKTAQFSKAAYVLKKAEEKTAKTKGKYVVLHVIAQDNVEGKLYVWHEHLRAIFSAVDLKTPQGIIVEVAERTEGNTKFIAVEHVIEIAGQAYVNDKPAEKAEASPDLDMFDEPGVGE